MKTFRMMILAGALAMPAMPTLAAETVDQSAVVGAVPAAPQAGRLIVRAGTISPSVRNALVGQTVTAGLDGLLTRIEVQSFVFNQPQLNGTLVLALFDGDVSAGGTYVGEVAKFLFEVPPTALFNANDLLTSFDVSRLGYRVTAGQRFSFGFAVTSTPDTSVGFVIGNGSRPDPAAPPVFDYNAYAGGNMLTSINGNPITVSALRDIGFRTFVDPAATGAVPEPESWIVLIAGFAGVGAAMRRRRKGLAPA